MTEGNKGAGTDSGRKPWTSPKIDSLGQLGGLVRGFGKTGRRNDGDPHDHRKSGAG